MDTSVEDAIPFFHPCTILLQGQSGCGKTEFAVRLLKEKLIQPFPKRIIWQYTEMQPAYETLKHLMGDNIVFTKTFDQQTYNSIRPKETNLLVLDDQMLEGINNKLVTTLFVQGSHHRNLTVIFMMQNMFHKGSQTRTITLNAKYVVRN